MFTNTTTSSREEMISAIYEKIARKDLSFGCRIVVKTRYRDEDDFVVEKVFGWVMSRYVGFNNDRHIKKIIWHPVMIGDVMDYFDFKIYNHWSYWYEMNRNLHDISWFWQEKRKPIEEQSEECIAFVYNLITE